MAVARTVGGFGATRRVVLPTWRLASGCDLGIRIDRQCPALCEQNSSFTRREVEHIARSNPGEVYAVNHFREPLCEPYLQYLTRFR
jgi:hypothetical protein